LADDLKELFVFRNPLSELWFSYALISTSTPEGKSSLESASTVLEDEVYISNKRLCVDNWNCSRLFLFT
jgi:hypothetical protein